MFGSEELTRLRNQKEALVVESSINRLSLLSETQQLKLATVRMKERVAGPRWLAPLLLIVPAIAGFAMVRARRGHRQRASLIGRIATVGKFAFPAYRLWRSLAKRREPARESPKPA
jgi:hypothetical protein